MIVYSIFCYLAFVTLDINEESFADSSMMISESFSKSFESLKRQLSRMTSDLNSLRDETKKLGSKKDSHSLRANMYVAKKKLSFAYAP